MTWLEALIGSRPGDLLARVSEPEVQPSPTAPSSAQDPVGSACSTPTVLRVAARGEEPVTGVGGETGAGPVVCVHWAVLPGSSRLPAGPDPPGIRAAAAGARATGRRYPLHGSLCRLWQPAKWSLSLLDPGPLRRTADSGPDGLAYTAVGSMGVTSVSA